MRRRHSAWCVGCGRHVSDLWPHDTTCPISLRDGRIADLEQRLAAAEADTRTEPVRNIEKISALVTELRDCRKRGLGDLWNLCETAADQIESLVAGDWS